MRSGDAFSVSLIKGELKMIIKADRIITGDGKTILENKAICITGEKIADIGDFEQLKKQYPDSPVKEYAGATITPGLIDMHGHIGYWWSRSDARDFNDFMIAFFAVDYLKRSFANGVTTIRDSASPKNLSLTINKAIKAGFIEGPRIITADHALSMTGGHVWENVGGTFEVNGPWEIRAAIRDNIKRGAQWTKIMSSHRSSIPEYTQEELNAAVDETHRVGKKAMVHAGTQPAIQMCIDAGFDTIEHGTYMTVEQAKQMAEKNQVWIPTITAYTILYERIVDIMENGGSNPGDLVFVQYYDYFRGAAEAYKNNFYKLYETGVKIAVGTDAVYDNCPATPVGLELKYMVKYGMPVLEAIKAATKSGAETLSIDGITGEISVGNQADILVVSGNPLDDIGAMEKVTELYFGGKSVYSA
ncbi:MAG: amidohydrolase family protein [Dehalobacterium sp.]